jgi:hypothetical protein
VSRALHVLFFRWGARSLIQQAIWVAFWPLAGEWEYSRRMKRPGAIRPLVGFVVGAALLLSLAAPARAQLDPITLSLMMGGFQLITGAITAITIGVGSDTKTGIALPYGTPCGIVDGVPQICWQPHAGGFEGSPDLPTGATSAPALSSVDSPGANRAPSPAQAQGQ